MKTQVQLLNYFGNPVMDRVSFERKWMVLWDIPDDINKEIPSLPNKIYINKILITPFEKVLRELISTGLYKEIKTWDGCFNIREKRGSKTISTHSWGIAVDMNAAWNKFKGSVSWSNEFLEVWRKNGWICGADWSQKYKDGMHFQGDNFF